jgi:hypothetical protein
MRELGGKRVRAAFVALAVLMTGVVTGTASAGVLDRIGQEKANAVSHSGLPN